MTDDRTGRELTPRPDEPSRGHAARADVRAGGAVDALLGAATRRTPSG